jgi:hypothetical protein
MTYEKISPAVMRALRAVERGEVYRKLRGRTSKMVGPKGVGEQTIRRLQWDKLITDGNKSGALNVEYTQVLTEAGREALDTGIWAQ